MRYFSVPFLTISVSFFGGTPLRDHFLRPRCAHGPPRRPRDAFLMIFDGFWAPFWEPRGSFFGFRRFFRHSLFSYISPLKSLLDLKISHICALKIFLLRLGPKSVKKVQKNDFSQKATESFKKFWDTGTWYALAPMHIRGEEGH